MPERILVVDDDRHMALAMQRALQRDGHQVDRAGGAEEALAAAARDRHALVVTDLRMPGVDGHALVQRLRNLDSRIAVVVVTAFGTVRSAVDCMKDGAIDYLLKPFSPENLCRTVRQALGCRACLTDDDAPPIAEDPATRATLELASRAARTDATVLLEAESGAGKEVFARLIHRESARARGPFVAVNCAALPRELLEAELFGHVRGAFTGAHRDRKGHFQMAHGGTLLLDEIGEMGADLQARLLRVLQQRLIQPVGSETPVAIDVRIVAATNRNLRAEVRAGRFREDLYYRLRVLPVRIPPLRERPGDIEPLARRFVERLGSAGIGRKTLDALCAHDWPGNVRELQNVLQRAAILAGARAIEPRDLQLEPPLRAESTGSLPHTLEEAERDTIRRVLERTGGNRTEAAEALGISPRTLRHKLKRYRDEGHPIGGPR